VSQIFYNVTLAVSDEVHDQWLQWMKLEHIPEALSTGLFVGATLMRVHAFEQGGKTYAVQYVCKDMDTYERYLREAAPALRAKTESRFGDQVHAFRTMLEVLDVFSPVAR
jgi:hypothetical protein